MQPEFWHERWRTGRIGFHQPATDRSLEAHWPRLRMGRGSRVFVPLCGKSLDLLWLRDRGHCVTGIELSATAAEAFFLENGVAARRHVKDAFDIYETEGLRFIRGDFFALTSSLLGRVDAVYDRAALISWTPALRARYVEHLASLLEPKALMLLISLEYPQSQMAGPPFSVSREEIMRLYSPEFSIEEISRQDVLASEARFRSAGVTELSEVCYQLVRR